MRSVKHPIFLVLSLFAFPAATFAQLPITFTTPLTGEQAVPPAATGASGTAIAVLVDDLLVVTGTYEGLSSELQPFNLGVLIHEAPEGETGFTVRLNSEAQGNPPVTLEPSLRLEHDGGRTGTFKGAFKLTDEQLQTLKAGGYYLALHTQSYPKGELRGQLVSDDKLDAEAADLAGLWVRDRGVTKGEEQLLLLEEDGSYRTEGVVGGLEASLERMYSRFVDDSGTFEFDGSTLSLTSGEITRRGAGGCQPGARWVHLVRLSRDGQRFRGFVLQDDCLGSDAEWDTWARVAAD